MEQPIQLDNTGDRNEHNNSYHNYSSQSNNHLKRSTSLIKPERGRIDSHHPQYHTHKKLSIRNERRHIHDHITEESNNRVSQLQIGLLENRNEAAPKNDTTMDTIHAKKSLFGPWMLFCYMVTCCCPPPILKALGRKDKNAQLAFREKMGLVTIILCIMGFVGFLTFGFTQVVCPRPPLNFRMEELNNGYVIIHGWAFLLASWSSHPPVNGITDKATSVIDEPFNAGGKDASFLFQNLNNQCNSIILPKSSNSVIGQGTLASYFPCQLIDTKNKIIPDPSTYANQSACHTKPTTINKYLQMKSKGILNSMGNYDKAGRVYFDWNDVNSTTQLTVYNGYVLNMNLLQAFPEFLFDIPENGLLQMLLKNNSLYAGQDITHAVSIHKNKNLSSTWKAEADCLLDLIRVGEIDTKSLGCIASDVVLYTSLIVILGVILVKFALAVVFGWFLSWNLGNFKENSSYKERMRREAEIEDWTTGINVPAAAIRPHRRKEPYTSPYSNPVKKRNLIPKTSRFTQPETGSTHYSAHEKAGSAIWKRASSSKLYGNGSLGNMSPRPTESPSENSRSVTASPLSRHSSFISTSDQTQSTQNTRSCPYEVSPHVINQPKPEYRPFGFNLVHTICLVTCYSEGEDGLRTTLDSIATTDYPNSHKLILVIADGIITGHGNSMSTPDICISMMRDFIVEPGSVEPHSYIAIADGKKRHNMAKIYAGFYRYDDNTIDRESQQKVPMITIVKCGTPEETAGKPGNRGKRDSQVILMSFLQKVMFDERMTELEYAFFINVWRITGVSPDKYEIVLMVDADTKVYPDALSRLVSCMVNDPEVMGLCGETKIGNKTDSWVSMIQVFEYYISHHQSKAFESIFGNVTCLPGCFCMYRIKAPKGNNGHWVPILANPDIIEHYSENVVDTLHKKNLLLLGEDRYLSTLMLRTFPRRKMLFVPQAVCKTVVPDSFMVLLSQRRRWINSTIHNLMELVFVRDLCGTFCFSMQFVVFMELVGTLALPAAISFTLYLIVLACIGQPAVLSLILLALILGLPAVLIVMTSRKLVYVGWMLIYLFSLPIWNFVLPSYAYWHFDDFTWGETRKVEGEGKDNHGDKDGEFDSSKITMKKWTDYEHERKVKEINMRSATSSQQNFSSPLSQWATLSTDLSVDIDQTELSTFLGSSLGMSPRASSSSHIPPVPFIHRKKEISESYLATTDDNEAEKKETDNEEVDDEDRSSVKSDNTTDSVRIRRSMDCLNHVSVELPTITPELDMDDDWEKSIMDSIQNKNVT